MTFVKKIGLLCIVLTIALSSGRATAQEPSDEEKIRNVETNGRKLVEELLAAYQNRIPLEKIDALWWKGKTRSMLTGIQSYEMIGMEYMVSYPRAASFRYRVKAVVKEDQFVENEWLIFLVREKDGKWKIARVAEPAAADGEMMRDKPKPGFVVFIP